MLLIVNKLQRMDFADQLIFRVFGSSAAKDFGVCWPCPLYFNQQWGHRLIMFCVIFGTFVFWKPSIGSVDDILSFIYQFITVNSDCYDETDG